MRYTVPYVWSPDDQGHEYELSSEAISLGVVVGRMVAGSPRPVEPLDIARAFPGLFPQLFNRLSADAFARIVAGAMGCAFALGLIELTRDGELVSTTPERQREPERSNDAGA